MSAESLNISGVYTVECYDVDGTLLWTDKIKNLVVTQGRNTMLDTYFTGSGYTAAWYMGLINNNPAPNYAITDTMGSHPGWVEFVGYTNTTRPLPVWTAASGGAKTSASTSFSIATSATIAGAFLTTSPTVGASTGLLFSAGTFSGGPRAVVVGQTLSVTYSVILT